MKETLAFVSITGLGRLWAVGPQPATLVKFCVEPKSIPEPAWTDPLADDGSCGIFLAVDDVRKGVHQQYGLGSTTPQVMPSPAHARRAQSSRGIETLLQECDPTNHVTTQPHQQKDATLKSQESSQSRIEAFQSTPTSLRSPL